MIFDLWDTLIDWDPAVAAQVLQRIEPLVGHGFQQRWEGVAGRYKRPIRAALADAGVPAEALEEVCAIRLEHHRGQMTPRPGAVATLERLRELGVGVGLITVCTEDVELLWPESEFAGLFDAEVFSSKEGLSKPDPAIYRLCCERLGVEPEQAVFVGDGANDELAGARRVGMEAILVHPSGEQPLWPEVRDWDGLRVTSIPEVLEVLQLS